VSPGGIDWVSSIGVLAAGLVLGSLFVWRLLARGRDAPTEPTRTPLVLRDLAGKREALVLQLRELEDTASKRDPRQLAQERYALELEAARVLMALDDGVATQAAEKAPPPDHEPEAPAAEKAAGLLARRPALRGFFMGAGAIAGMGLLLYFASRSATERAPGASPTGGGPAQGQTAPPSEADEAQLQAILAQNPDDVETRLALVRSYLGRQDMMGVWNETQKVLERVPGEPRALSFQSLVRLAMGQPELALEMLTEALRTDPDVFDAYVHLGLVYVRLGRVSEAEQTIQEASERFPDRRELLQQLWIEIRTQQPVGSSEAAPAAHADAGGDETTRRRLAGFLELDASLEGSVAPDAVIFIAVRPTGGGGAPVAVSRLVASGFPLPFEVTGALPDTVDIEARIDSDGDAMTRDPSEPVAEGQGLAAGSEDVRLVFRVPR
jgi:tetratricopeptide (TPR) repeat protein